MYAHPLDPLVDMADRMPDPVFTDMLDSTIPANEYLMVHRDGQIICVHNCLVWSMIEHKLLARQSWPNVDNGFAAFASPFLYLAF